MKSITVTRPCESKEAHVADKRYFAPPPTKLLLLVCLCTNVQGLFFNSAEVLSTKPDKWDGTAIDVSEGF